MERIQERTKNTSVYWKGRGRIRTRRRLRSIHKDRKRSKNSVFQKLSEEDSGNDLMLYIGQVRRRHIGFNTTGLISLSEVIL